MPKKHYLLPVLFSLLLAGCAGKTMPDAVDENTEQLWTPPVLPEAAPQQVVDGSLFHEVSANSLFEDRMAYRVGDILTIKLDEKTTSSYSAGTKSDKSSSFNMGIPVFWGNQGEATSLGVDRNFNGNSSGSQQNMLDGSITVSVIRVMPNGTLYVRGEKLIRLNQGDEFIRIAGILRPEDIAPDNSISSQRLANARIVYSGEGSLHNATDPGWLTDFFNDPVFPM